MVIAEVIFLILGGIFSFCGGFFEWRFFVNNGKFKSMQKLFGYNGARIFYMVIGVFIVVMSVIILIRS